jgi:hypothetical protein
MEPFVETHLASDPGLLLKVLAKMERGWHGFAYRVVALRVVALTLARPEFLTLDTLGTILGSEMLTVDTLNVLGGIIPGLYP